MFKVGGGFKNQRYAYDANGNVEYLGEHALSGASIDDPKWNIWKIAYDLNGRVSSRQGPLEGKWSEREQFGW